MKAAFILLRAESLILLRARPKAESGSLRFSTARSALFFFERGLLFFFERGRRPSREAPFLILPLLFFSLCQPTVSLGATVEGRIVSKVLPNLSQFVIYLKPVGTQKSRGPSKIYKINQKGMEFIPHILPIPVGSSVTFGNSDDEIHIIHSTSDAAKFNFSVLPGKESPPKKFDQSGEVQLLCDIHPQMSSYILVLDTPHFAVTDKKGAFTIEGISSGRYLLATWHEQVKSTERELLVKSDSPKLSIDIVY